MLGVSFNSFKLNNQPIKPQTPQAPNTPTTNLQKSMGDTVSFGTASAKDVKKIGNLLPEQFQLWVKKFIKADGDKEVKFVDTFDSSISDEMRSYIFLKERSKGFPESVKLEDGSTWNVSPVYDDYHPELNIYDQLKIEKNK